MSFEQKYLKYKSKYLALKAQINTISIKSQNGGSIYGTSLDQLDFLSETPSNNKNLYNKLNNQNNYKLSGGNTESETPASEEEKSASKEETPVSETPVSEEEKPVSETPVSEEEKPVSETPVSETPVSETPVSETPVSETPVSETPVSEEEKPASDEEESEQGGGSKQSKGKSHKKYFFDDSDMNLDSTTTDSDLSSLKTDSTDD